MVFTPSRASSKYSDEKFHGVLCIFQMHQTSHVTAYPTYVNTESVYSTHRCFDFQQSHQITAKAPRELIELNPLYRRHISFSGFPKLNFYLQLNVL